MSPLLHGEESNSDWGFEEKKKESLPLTQRAKAKLKKRMRGELKSVVAE